MQHLLLTVSSGTIIFTTPTVVNGQAAPVASAIYTKVPVTAEQESYDYSGITLAVGDRVSLTIGTKTYTQEFTTNQASTLSALGALVVNGDASMSSKTVDAMAN